MRDMRCYRRDCTNILCNRYSPIYGNICSDCFKELVDKGMETDVREFLNTSKIKERDEESENHFDKIFAYRIKPKPYQ